MYLLVAVVDYGREGSTATKTALVLRRRSL
jgi:hypothetical protein